MCCSLSKGVLDAVISHKYPKSSREPLVLAGSEQGRRRGSGRGRKRDASSAWKDLILLRPMGSLWKLLSGGEIG